MDKAYIPRPLHTMPNKVVEIVKDVLPSFLLKLFLEFLAVNLQVNEGACCIMGKLFNISQTGQSKRKRKLWSQK